MVSDVLDDEEQYQIQNHSEAENLVSAEAAKQGEAYKCGYIAHAPQACYPAEYSGLTKTYKPCEGKCQLVEKFGDKILNNGFGLDAKSCKCPGEGSCTSVASQ